MLIIYEGILTAIRVKVIRGEVEWFLHEFPKICALDIC